MSISTIRHRHSYDFPAGYVCKVDRDALCQLIYALLPESCPLITPSGAAAGWILYFSTLPIEPRELIVIGDKLDALASQYRKPPQS